ncbi:hypothetical protein CAEBREN_10443 [Caenorhabditis brenneri]|uniref:F-box domain-containing protein n=1 Tax=Caenorhabditis brenneri TaxID=135651 RepID=G0P1I1_CAEBE|nr:hypothetical protein CAEBREN_10443 [Caenorhabditis brenneri]
MPKELETFEYWVELPPEMKDEVIKSLEMKERSNLRCTAKTEMLLVDKAKFSLKSLSVIVNEHTTDVRVAEMSGSEQNLVFRGTDFKKKVRHILSYLFQHCSRFGEIKICRSDDILTEDCFLFPIKTRKLSLTDCSNSQVLLFAKKCDADCVDVAEITHRHERFSVNVLSSILVCLAARKGKLSLDLQKLNPTKLINIHYQHSDMLAFGAAVLWMDEDVADYARIIFSSQIRNELENFRFTFEDETVRL